MSMSRRVRAVLIVAGSMPILTLLDSVRRDAVAATPTRYEQVKDWPNLPPDVKLGETAGVAVDVNGHVLVFHRPGRGFDLAAKTRLVEPTVLEIDATTGKL